MEVKMHYKNISEVRDEINDIKEPEGTLIDNKLILDLDKLHNNVSPPPELNEVCIYKTDGKIITLSLEIYFWLFSNMKYSLMLQTINFISEFFHIFPVMSYYILKFWVNWINNF